MPLESKEPEQEKVNRNIEGHSYRVFYILKVSLFFFCTAGFIYQAGQFLQSYWRYPTVIDLAVEKPEYIIEPAFSFCSSATIVRNKYCDMYPDDCKIIEVAKEPICKTNPDYCAENVTHDRIPELSVPSRHYMRTNEVERLVEDVTNLFADVYRFPKVQGPFVYYGDAFFDVLFCYTINSHVESGYEPSLLKLNKDLKDEFHVYKYIFHVFPSEVLYPWTEAGMYFHIHSPFTAVNPAMDGTFMKPGKKYTLQVHMEEERLLPPPYPTNCKNYSAVWEQNNRTGVRTQEMCLEKCKATFDLICGGCIRRTNLYPSARKCESKFFGFCNEHNSTWNATKDCINTCRPDCVKLKYHYSVYESNVEPWFYGPQKIIEVSVILDQNEVPVRIHKPHYQDVELFSYLGGFLGCWLGISLYAFGDIIKNSYHLLCQFYRKIELKRIRLKHV